MQTLKYFQNEKKKKIFFAPDNMKKTPSKSAHNRPIFSVLPIGPKPAQITLWDFVYGHNKED